MIPYLLTVSLVLIACLCFYLLLLQKETFYLLNRHFLLAAVALSFCLPLIPVPAQWSLRYVAATALSKPTSTSPGNSHTVPGRFIENKKTSADGKQDRASSETNTGTIDLIRLLAYIYWTGAIVFAINLIIQISSLLYRVHKQPAIKDGKYRIVELQGDKSPCSFIHYIFINPEKYDWDVYDQILKHEKIHVDGWHIADILVAELAIVFLWFNPFAWLYRRIVENNLEFLTDDQLLKNQNVDKAAYQFNLLKVSVPHFPLGITINYNQSLLKKRILMMSAKRSSLGSLWKYLFIVPLLIVSASLLNEPAVLAQQQALPVPGYGNDHFVLSGKISGVEKATVLLSYINKDGKAVTERSTLNDGNFYFSGKIAVPTLASISEATGMGIAQVFLEPGNMTATVEKDKFREMVIRGSKNQLEHDSLLRLLEPILKESWPLEAAYLEANNKLIVADLGKADKTVLGFLKLNAEKALAAVDPSTDAVAAIVYRFAEQHPDSYHAAWQASSYNKRWSTDSTRRLYNKMGTAIQQSVYGKELKEMIDRTK